MDNPKIRKCFSVSEHAVKQARKFKKEEGILATPSNYYREGLDKETLLRSKWYMSVDVA